MTMHHHHHAYRPSPLEIKQLAEFDDTIDELPPDEQRRRRVFYLRDAARQAGVGASMLKGFGCLLIPFAIIPLFWPFLIFFWFIRKKSLNLMDQQMQSALEYWNIARHEVLDTPEPPPGEDERSFRMK